MFIAALFTIAKIWKQPKCPSVDEWIEQLGDTYTMEYYLAVKKEESFTLCDMDGSRESFTLDLWMDLEKIMLSEISQVEKDEYNMISLICGI